MKFYLVFIFVLFLSTSCSSVKDEIPVAGELICTAAGVDAEECIKAAKIDNDTETTTNN
tara:strand:+ start:140 stop:316 length:177 start_codon:yes stop_codon:yes gene_type:complete